MSSEIMNTPKVMKESNIFKLDENDNSHIVARCTEILHKGGIIAVPTDTLYGVACLAQCTEAVERLYALKSRNALKPVAICVGETYDICHWARFPQALFSSLVEKLTLEEKNISPQGALQRFLNDLLPGPITLITERSPALNSNLNPKISSVGIRVPDFDFIRDLANRLNEPLALTSANVSGDESSLCIEDFSSLWPSLDAVVDGGVVGTTHVNKKISYTKEGSTIVKLLPDGVSFKIIRAGCAYESTVQKLKSWNLKLTL